MDAGGVLGYREHLAHERSWWDVLTADEYLTDPLGRRSARGGQCERALRADAVGLLPDVRRLSGYYRAAEHCSSTESQHGYDMHANESR